MKINIPYNLHTAKGSEKSENGSSFIMFDVTSPFEVDAASVPMYNAVRMEDCQCLTMLSPQREKSAKVTRVNLTKDTKYAVNLLGDRTSEKIKLTTTGNMVNDTTF